MTATLPTIGQVVQVQVSTTTTNRWGGIDDCDPEVDVTVTAEMLDSWERWGDKYESFEAMLRDVHHDEVWEAGRA